MEDGYELGQAISNALKAAFNNGQEYAWNHDDDAVFQRQYEMHDRVMSQFEAFMERQAFRASSLESRIMELEMQMAKRAYKLEEAYNEIKRMTDDPHN